MGTLLLGWIVSKAGDVDGAFADSVIGDGVFIHDCDFEEVVVGGEGEGFVPDWPFACFVFGSGAEGLGSEA